MELHLPQQGNGDAVATNASCLIKICVVVLARISGSFFAALVAPSTALELSVRRRLLDATRRARW